MAEENKKYVSILVRNTPTTDGNNTPQTEDYYIRDLEAQQMLINKQSKPESIEYDTLLSLKNSSGLEAGKKYEISDYYTNTTIIVEALSSSVLSEDAEMIINNESTSSVECLKVKYYLDNDTERFGWADTDECKGVIYYMKDEHNNEAPFDFRSGINGYSPFNFSGCFNNTIHPVYENSKMKLPTEDQKAKLYLGTPNSALNNIIYDYSWDNSKHSGSNNITSNSSFIVDNNILPGPKIKEGDGLSLGNNTNRWGFIYGSTVNTVGLDVRDNTTLGLGSNDTLIVNAVSTFKGGVFIKDQLTVNGGDITLGTDSDDTLIVNAGSTFENEVEFKEDVNFEGGLSVKNEFILGTDSYDNFNLTVNIGTSIFNNNLIVNGKTTLGDDSSDILIVNSKIDSDLLPTIGTSAIHSLGSSNSRWKGIYGENLNISSSATFTGDLIAGGDITLGTDSDDTLIVNATINSDLIPGSKKGGSTCFLGYDKARWEIYGHTLNISGNTTLGDNKVYDTLTVNSKINSDLLPVIKSSKSDYCIGSDNNKWKGIYGENLNISSSATLNGAILNGTLTVNAKIVSDLIPDSTGIKCLGNNEHRWKTIYTNRAESTNGFYQTSDENLKTDLSPISVNLDDISKLRKVYYNWKENPSETRQLGMIAQDVQKLYPELVNTDNETGNLSLSYDKLSVIALEGIDVLYKEHKELEGKYIDLEKRLEALENYIKGEK